MLLALLLAATLPDFTGYVVDKARVLDASAVQHVTDVSSRLDHAGIAQLAVATVPASDLGDQSLEDYAVALFQKWGLGHGKKRDDGLLVLFVPGQVGHRQIRIEVGYGLEGILPDGKVGQIRTERAFPFMKRDDYSGAAMQVVDALAAILEKDAAAGGDAAPAKDSLRGGTGIGMTGSGAAQGYGGLGITILCMGALAVMLASSGARRRFPGKGAQLAGAGLTAASVASLVALGSGPGWLALAAGLIVNAVIWTSIRAHRCPKEGSWMTIDQEIIDEPTRWSQGRAHVRQICTNPRCGYRREYDKILPRRGGFAGGGGGRSGGGGAGGEV